MFDITLNYYQKRATVNDQTSESFQQTLLINFLNHLQAQPYFNQWNVLDFGTGIGNNLSTLSKYFKNIETCDVNPKIIDKLKRKFPQFKHHLIDSRYKIPARKCWPKHRPVGGLNTKYNLIVATEVLEHIPNYPQIIRQFSQWLKPKGWLIISTPNYFNLAGLVKWFHDRDKFRPSWSPWPAHQNGWETAMTYYRLKNALKTNFIIHQLRGADLYLAWLFWLPNFFQRLRRYLVYPPFQYPILGKISMHSYILAQKK